MALSQTDNGDGTTTVTFSYAANTTKIVDGLTNAAIYLYTNGFTNDDTIDVNNLTDKQISDVVDAYVLHTIKELAKSYYVQAQIDMTRSQAIEYSEDNLF